MTIYKIKWYGKNTPLAYGKDTLAQETFQLHLEERTSAIYFMIQDIFETGKDIFELSPALCAKKVEERHKLANLLELIGHRVKDTVVNLRQGKLPAGKIQQLEMLSEELYFRLACSVGEIKARTLSGKLKRGYMASQFQSELDESQSAYHHLTVLEAAAGYFLATSDNLRTATS